MLTFVSSGNLWITRWVGKTSLLNAIPLGTCENAIKPVNTKSLKHVTKTLKNEEKNPRPSGDLIPRNM